MSWFKTSVKNAVLAVVCLVSVANVYALPEGFTENEVLGGLYQPTSFKFAPNGPQVFVTEKRGLVKVFDSVNSTNGRTIYNIEGQVYTKYDNGLSSVAIHPDFPSTPYIYIAYSRSPSGSEFPGNNGARLDRLRVNDQLTSVTEVVTLLDNWCVSSANHATGDLHFGPEGALYMSAGSFASSGQFNSDCGEPDRQGGSLKSQDYATPGDHLWFNGTMIRVDPITGNAWPGNALSGGDSSDDPLIAYGLRNPFRFVIHPDNGQVFIADVGWEHAEEINVIENANALPNNYGWPCYEGVNRQPTYESINLSVCNDLYQANNDTKPFYQYGLNPAGAGLSITGITINGDNTFPAQYNGALFYADYVKRYVDVMYAGSNGLPDPSTKENFDWGRPIIQLSMGPDGNLYYIEFNVGEGGDQERYAVWQVAPTEQYEAKIEGNSVVAPGTTIDFSASKTTLRANSQNSYEWDLDGDGNFDDSNSEAPSFTFNNVGSSVVSVRASNTFGDSDVAHHLVMVTDEIPEPVITAPVIGQTWGTNEVVEVAGFANIPATGQAADHMSWTISLRHCERLDETKCHGHPVDAFDDNDPNTPAEERNRFVGPDHDFPSFLQVQLTAFGPETGVEWALPEWDSRRTIFINNADGGFQSNYALRVNFEVDTIDYSRAGSNGSSLRFTDANGNVVQHFVSSWNTQGQSVVWVLLGNLEANKVNQFLRVYYGNNSASSTSNNSGLNMWDNAERASVGPEESQIALQSSVIVPFDPRTALLTMDSDPQGLELTVFSYTDRTPFNVELIEGSNTTITAPQSQIDGMFQYDFVSWDNGMERAVDNYVSPIGGETLIATYEEVGIVNCRFEEMYFRGTPNSWGTTPMTLGANCRWEIQVTFTDGDNPRFKFDASGNWTESYADSNNDGIADTGSGDINITEGVGDYLIVLNDDLSYQVTKIVGNQAPIANAGSDVTVLVNESVTLNGSASSDADGSIVSYAWDGQGVSGPLSGVQQTVSFATTGTYSITLTVTDNEGATSTDTVVITVVDEIAFQSNYPTMSITGTFNGWTPGATPMSLVADNTWSIDIALDAADQFKFTAYSNWTVNFGANGGAGNIPVPNGTNTYRVTFNDSSLNYTFEVLDGVDQAPSVTITSPSNNSSVLVDETVTFTATANDNEDGALTSSIVWLNAADQNIGTGASLSQSYTSVGSYTVTASVTDSAGQTTETSVTINVGIGQAPSVTITSPSNNTTVLVDEAVTFTATASDNEDGSLTSSIVWLDSADQNIGMGANLAQTFTAVGQYTITASVTDSSGQTTETSVVVNVTDQVQFASNYDTMHLTGTHNGWTLGEDALTLIADNTWSITLALAATDQFKFTPYLNWNTSFGANGGSGNIAVTQGANVYQITFNDITKAYSMQVVGGVDLPPTVSIGSPANNSTVLVSETVTFSASANDQEDGSLTSSIVWLDELGETVGTGANYTTSFDQIGQYTVFASVTDSEGQTTETSIVINVTDSVAWNSNYDNMYLTGTHNSWTLGQTPMTLVADNTWSITIDLAANSEFKFTPFLTWGTNFGNNGGNIVVADGAGTYVITFFDDSTNYTVVKQ